MVKSPSPALPAFLFFAFETAFGVCVSSKTAIFYALSFSFWGILALVSAAILRSRSGRAAAIVLPSFVFNLVVLLKLLPGRVASVSNLGAIAADVLVFGLAALAVRRAWLDRRGSGGFFFPAGVLALANNIASFFILPDLPVDRIGSQISALFLAGLVLPLGLIWAGGRLRRIPPAARPVRPGPAVLAAAASVILIFGSSAAGIFTPPPSGTARTGGPPNVVLIVMDTARRTELSVYGYPGATSPRLAGLARDGVAFDRAYANANWTIPSHACLLTGFLSSITRTNFQNARTGDIAPLLPEFRTAATILREAGFHTASFPSNSYSLCRRFGFDQGFETLWSGAPRDANLTAALLAHKLVRSPRAADWVSRHLPLVEYISAAALNKKIFRWLDGRGGDPFFLFVNYTEPHGTNALPRGIKRAFGVAGPPPLWRRDPKTGAPELDEGSRADLRRWYDAELAAVDAEIGRFLDRLKARGLYDNTLVVVTSDHGELLGEHGEFGHVVWLYEPTIHIPLIIKYPKGEASGTRSDRLVSHVDVFAEILARTGRPLPADIQGRPFDVGGQAVISEYRPTSAFAVPWPERYGYGQTAIISFLSNGAKMIRSDTGREELFDLAADPGELRDLTAPALRAAVGRELDEKLDTLEKISRKSGDRFKKVKFDSLGYVK